MYSRRLGYVLDLAVRSIMVPPESGVSSSVCHRERVRSGRCWELRWILVCFTAGFIWCEVSEEGTRVGSLWAGVLCEK